VEVILANKLNNLVDTVAAVVVLTVDVVKEIAMLFTTLLGCRDIDGSQTKQI